MAEIHLSQKDAMVLCEALGSSWQTELITILQRNIISELLSGNPTTQKKPSSKDDDIVVNVPLQLNSDDSKYPVQAILQKMTGKLVINLRAYLPSATTKNQSRRQFKPDPLLATTDQEEAFVAHITQYAQTQGIKIQRMEYDKCKDIRAAAQSSDPAIVLSWLIEQAKEFPIMSELPSDTISYMWVYSVPKHQVIEDVLISAGVVPPEGKSKKQKLYASIGSRCKTRIVMSSNVIALAQHWMEEHDQNDMIGWQDLDEKWLLDFDPTALDQIAPEQHNDLICKIRYLCRNHGLNKETDPALLRQAIANAIKIVEATKKQWTLDDVTPDNLSVVALEFKIRDFGLIDENNMQALISRCIAKIKSGGIVRANGIARIIKKDITNLRRKIARGIRGPGGDKRRKNLGKGKMES